VIGAPHADRQIWRAALPCTLGRVRATLIFCVVTVLGACGGSSGDNQIQADTPTNTEPAAPTTTAAPCDPQRSDCSPEELVAAVRGYYTLMGATPDEIDCLVGLTDTSKSAVNEVLPFSAPTDEQMRTALECVGSEARLREIAEAGVRLIEDPELLEEPVPAAP